MRGKKDGLRHGALIIVGHGGRGESLKPDLPRLISHGV